MNDATIAPAAGAQFAPQALVAVRVVSTSANLYPVVDETMEVHEGTHTFHINKAALALQTITSQLQLDALGNQLNLPATVAGVIHDWIRFYQDNW